MHTRPTTTKLLTGLLASVLAAALLSTGLAAAESPGGVPAGFTLHDDETVYVVADADGTTQDVVVIDWMRLDGSGTATVLDPGDVTDAEALEDDIEPVLTGDGVEWTLPVDGRRDFFYRAETTRHLPIEVEARYFLDGQRIDPADLAGRDGRVRIEVTVTNSLVVTESVPFADADDIASSRQAEYWVPMLAPVKIDIDGTRFSDIDAEDAQIVSVSGSTVSHTFMAFPQPEETVTIEMDGIDIEIEPIIVSVFPKMAGSPDFSVTDDLAELREGLDGLTQLSEGHRLVLGSVAEGIDPASLAGIDQAPEGFARLADGTREIGAGASGLAALLDAQIAYLDGILGGLRSQDYSGIAALPSTVATLAAGVADAAAGVDGMVVLLDGQIAYLDAIAASNAGLETQAWALVASSTETATVAAATQIATGLSTQTAMLAALRDGDEALGMPMGLTDTRATLAQIALGLHQVAGGLDALATGAAPLAGLPGEFDRLASALETLRDGGTVPGAGVLPGLADARDGLHGVAGGIDEIGTGIDTAAGALEPLSELPGMLGELRDTLLALRDGGRVRGADLPGVSTTVEGLSAMSDGLADGIGDARFGEAVTERMKEAAAGYDTFLGKPEGATGDVRFIFRLDGISAEDAEE